MGLDITLGILVLLAGIRGWLKGFVLQAIQITAIIGCVYLADPVRDLAKPYAHDYFPTIRPELMDKLLWWVAAVVSYLILSGVPTSLVRLYRRRPTSELEPRWGDFGGGFLLGLAKGLVLVGFLTWAIEIHALPRYAKEGGWVAQQMETSQALAFSSRYRPAEKVWTSQPVQTYVQRIKDRGFWSEGAPPKLPLPEPPPPVNARTRSDAVPAFLPRPTLIVPGPDRLDPKSPTFLHDLDTALKGTAAGKSR